MIDPLDLRSFPPVEPLSAVPESWRQTMISKFVECPRSAYLYLRYGGGALTHPLAGGTLLHRATERYIRTLIEQDEHMGNPELAKDILNEVLVESTDLQVSPERYDSLRAMIFHLAEGLVIDPEKVVFLETPVSVEIGGRTITGTIDFGELDDNALTMIDWKSAYFNAARPDIDENDEEYVPTREEWPGGFQLTLYAYAAAKGSIDNTDFNFNQVPEFRLRQVHPRQFWENAGTMAYREAVIDRSSLLDWGLYLESTIAKMETAFQTWEFPAIMGSHCDFCPSSADCPIPPALRNYRGEIRTEDDARRAAIMYEALGRRRSEIWDGLKGWAKSTGRPLRFGRDREFRWRKRESEKLKDKVAIAGSSKKIKGRDALHYAVQRLDEVGTPLDWTDYFTKSVSTRYEARTLTPKELDDEQNGDTQ